MDNLAEVIKQHNLPALAADCLSQLELYCRYLWNWNRRINLTRHDDYEKFVTRDLIDTLQLSSLIPPGQEVLDVGTGGGVPGVVLGILRPDLEIVLSESVAKKANAVDQIVQKLNLPIPVYNCRAEDLLEDLRFDALVARAVGPLAKLCRWLQPCWNHFRCLLAIKGPRWVEERSEARESGLLESVQLRKVHSYPMPGTESESVILKLWASGRDEPFPPLDLGALEGSGA